MYKIMILLAALISAAVPPAAAQKPDIKGGTAVASEPGKAAAVRAIEISAQVVAINKGSRTLSLKGPQGNVVDVVAGNKVRNFAKIKVGDLVVVRAVQALSLELQPVKSGASGISEQTTAARAKPGARPAAGAAREVTAIAQVTGVDPKASTITLKGPRGNEVTLDVQNKDHFKVVKVGDEVLVNYTEAVAISVEPGPKKAAAKKDAGAKK